MLFEIFYSHIWSIEVISDRQTPLSACVFPTRNLFHYLPSHVNKANICCGYQSTCVCADEVTARPPVAPYQSKNISKLLRNCLAETKTQKMKQYVSATEWKGTEAYLQQVACLSHIYIYTWMMYVYLIKFIFEKPKLFYFSITLHTPQKGIIDDSNTQVNHYVCMYVYVEQAPNLIAINKVFNSLRTDMLTVCRRNTTQRNTHMHMITRATMPIYVCLSTICVACSATCHQQAIWWHKHRTQWCRHWSLWCLIWYS